MREDTRRKILDVTLELTKRLGFWSFKVEDILQYAHISRATFYKYFSNRNEVLFALLDDESEKIDARIRSAVDAQPLTYDKLKVLITLGIAGIRELLDILNVRIHETDLFMLTSKERIERINKRDLAIFKEILSEGQREGALVFEDPDITARVVVGAGREIGFRAIEENKDIATVEREVSEMLNVLFYGISSRGRR
jgi:AcrR family transcriptional regulator